MLVCPKCKNEISPMKLFTLGIIKCESCSSYLKQKLKRKIYILLIIVFPAMGSLFGAFLGDKMYGSGELIYLLFLPLFILFVGFAALGVSILIIKLEVTDPPQSTQSLTPPPFNIS